MANSFQYKQSASDRANANTSGESERSGSTEYNETSHAIKRAKVAFIERKYWRKEFLAFSIEKVFEQIARLLDSHKFEAAIVKVPHGNSLAAIVKNLVRFKRPVADIYHITGQI